MRWNIWADVKELRRERAEDRTLIREILAQVLAITDKQTALLEQWITVVAERQAALRVQGSPRTYTLTPDEEYRQWAQKHHPELLEPDEKSDYGKHDREAADEA